MYAFQHFGSLKQFRIMLILIAYFKENVNKPSKASENSLCKLGNWACNVYFSLSMTKLTGLYVWVQKSRKINKMN